MNPPGRGRKPDDPRTTPTNDRVERARQDAVAMTEVRKDLEHLGEKVDTLTEAVQELADVEHPCSNEGRFQAHEERIETIRKRLDWSRGLTVTAVVFLLGTVVTVLVTCNERDTQDAETRVMVRTNASNISKLEKSIEKVNDGRDADVKAILRAVRKAQHEARQETAEDWWDNLPVKHKRAIIRAVGSHAIPTNGPDASP